LTTSRRLPKASNIRPRTLFIITLSWLTTKRVFLSQKGETHEKIFIIISIVSSMIFTFGNITWAYDNHRFGGGIHYWVATEDIDEDNVDEEGIALILSYQYQMAGSFKLEGNLEYLGEGYAGSADFVLSPQLYLLIGRGLYGGVGIGINYSNGDFADQPYFALRVGVDFEILPSIFLDINANYRFEKWDFDEIEEDIDTDIVTLGAIVRFEF